MFYRGDATADTNLEAAVRKLVDHADFFEQAERVIERKEIHQRAELELLRLAGGRSKEDGLRWRLAERFLVVFSEVVAVEAQFIGTGEQFKPFVELAGEGNVIATLHVVEDPKSHSARILAEQAGPGRGWLFLALAFAWR